mgnify:CR=1 FL=1
MLLEFQLPPSSNSASAINLHHDRLNPRFREPRCGTLRQRLVAFNPSCRYASNDLRREELGRRRVRRVRSNVANETNEVSEGDETSVYDFAVCVA